MQANMCPLPQWQCHKVVRAAQIESINDQHRERPVLGLAGGHRIAVDASWVERHGARVGGYYVVYEDGYRSYSTQAAFEGGYTPIPITEHVPVTHHPA